MPELRGSGTWTILFTDLVGSTELRSGLGDVAADELRRTHDQLLSDAVSAHGGEVVKGLGDGIMAAFAGAAEALSCAVSIQQAVDHHNRTATPAFDVRVGVSLGDASAEDGDLFGTPVVEAARLCAKAGGGEILCTDVVRVVAGSRAGVELEPVGDVELKGLPDPIGAARVLWEPLSPDDVAATGVPVPPGLDPGTRLVFCGRAGELEEVVTRWKQAAEGERSVVLVAGEPGVGKTRLSSEAARIAHSAGALVLYGRCDDELGVPYQPFVEALAYHVEQVSTDELTDDLGRHAGDLARLVPVISERLPSLPTPLESDPDTEQYRLFDAVAGWLSAASRRRPILLVLDDLHWAAKPTLLMLRHVLGTPAPASVLVVATYRDTDLDRAHPLAEALADLRRRPNVERVSLVGLDPAGVLELLEATAGHELDDEGYALAAAIHRETEGNPFFIGEVLRHLAESGAVMVVDGRWTVTADIDSIGIPEGVREVIGRRLNRLSEDANQTLVLASVIGRGFDLPVLESVSDLGEDAILEALDEAVEARVVREVDVGRYRFAHALVRSTLYDELRPTRRARLHGRVGEAIESAHSARIDDHLGELAHHFTRAAAGGDAGKALEYSRRAGAHALEQLAQEEAVTHFEEASELLEDAEADDRVRGEVLLGLGVARRYAGVAGSRNAVLDAARAAQAAGDDDLLVRAALATHRGFFSVVGVVDEEIVAVVRAALAALGDAEVPTRARLLANLATELIFGESLEHRRELSDEALAIARELDDGPTLAHVLVTRCAALWFPTTHDERMTLTQELVGLADDRSDPYLQFWGRWYRYATVTEAGDRAEADALAEELSALVAEVGQATTEWVALFTRAGHELLRGALDRAEELAIESLELGERAGEPDSVFFFGTLLFTIRWRQGRLAEMIDLVKASVEEASGLHGVAGMLGITYAETGRLDDARVILDDLAGEGFRDFPHNQIWSSVVWGVVSITTHLGDAERARDLITLLEPCGDRLAYQGLCAFASVPAMLGSLYDVVGDRAAAEDAFGRALALEIDGGAPMHAAATRLSWARALLGWGGEGDAERAAALLDEVRATGAELGVDALVAEADAIGG